MNINKKPHKFNYRESANLDFYKGAKLQPQAPDLENVVLGALMIDRDAINYVIDRLKPKHFYNEFHGHIYQAIITLFNNSYPIDLLTVSNQLESEGKLNLIGGRQYLADLTVNVNSAANIEFHSMVIIENAIRREVIKKCSFFSSEAFDPSTDIFETLDSMGNSIYEITQDNIRKESQDIGSVIKESIREYDKKKNSKFSGIPTGFLSVDRISNGWQNSDLIIVAARPGMGKTSFILNAARNAAIDFKIPVAIFSLEMSSKQLGDRLILCETEVSANDYKTGNLSDHDFEKVIYKSQTLYNAPLFIDDTAALSILELRAKSRRLKSQHNIQLIVVDYLQLMTTNQKTDNREQEISIISRQLKSLAKELNVPVIALSQLNRMVEQRADKRPMLSDLRESGAIEQDADQVVFLYRPSYYGQDQEVCEANDCEIIFAKNRNGSIGSATLTFIDKHTKFINKND